MGFAGWIKRRHASALLLLTAATCAMAAPATGDSTALAGSARACGLRAPLPPAWTAPDRWAWRQIRQSRAAHFDALLGTQKGSGRQTPDRFGDARRILSAGFLRAVLVQEPFPERRSARRCPGRWRDVRWRRGFARRRARPFPRDFRQQGQRNNDAEPAANTRHGCVHPLHLRG